MIESVKILKHKDSPLSYILEELDRLKEGSEFIFKPGTNVIVGPNGSGKTTLLRLIQYYNLVKDSEMMTGKESFDDSGMRGFKPGIEVKADYENVVFRLAHPDEYSKGGSTSLGLATFKNFGTMFMSQNSSTGEGILSCIGNLFDLMFNPNTNLKFPEPSNKQFKDYVEKNRIKTDHRIFTVILDEPDRNLDLGNIESIKNILEEKRDDIQLLTVVHNPVLLCALKKNPSINFVELESGYLDKIEKTLKSLII